MRVKAIVEIEFETNDYIGQYETPHQKLDLVEAMLQRQTDMPKTVNIEIDKVTRYNVRTE